MWSEHTLIVNTFRVLLQNALLEFVRVVKAEEQVVAGTLHHLTLEAIEAGTKKIYEAKVWVKPWLNFKELQEFKHTGDATPSKHTGDATPSFTRSDLGVKQGEPHFLSLSLIS